MKIRLNNSADATAVVSIANKFKDCDIDGSIGRCIIDLKSILGVLSFGLPKVIDITVRSDDKALVKEFSGGAMTMDEMLTPTDIQKHLKIGRNKTYQLIQLSSFPKIKIGNTYRSPKEKYLKWISDNIRKTIFL